VFLQKYRINGYVIAEAVEENKQRYQVNQALYRKRQEINEYIFGTIKRQWGYCYGLVLFNIFFFEYS
jgi:hypothetical protein